MARIARIIVRRRIVEHLRWDVVPSELGLIVTELIHVLSAREDGRVRTKAGERAVEIVKQDVLRTVAVHRDALTRVDPLAVRRREVREVGARFGIDRDLPEKVRRYCVG